MAGNKYLYNNGGKFTEAISTQTSAGVADANKIIALDATGKINNSLLSPSYYSPLMGAVPLINGTFVKVGSSNLAIGDNEIYTVPSGNSFLIEQLLVFNGSGGANTIYVIIKVGSTYYRITTSVSLASSVAQSFISMILLMPGDKIYVNCTATGANCFVTGTLFDESSNIKPQRKLGLSSGDNTLYTCPSGKIAKLLNGVVIDGVSSVFNIIADSGGTRTAYINLVPNGGSPSLGNRVTSTLTIPANTRITSLATLNLEQGDFINFNIDVGDPSQSIWFKVIELEV